MRLLGIIEKPNGKLLLVQDKERFFAKEDAGKNFGNYSFLKNRDKNIGNPMKKGEGVFNFRYGPVNSGVGEAGIFNICTYGERIISANIDPSYKKRGIEEMIKGSNVKKALRLSEDICSNFAFSHSTAFLRAIENAGKLHTDTATKRIRIVALELERIYNHLFVMARLSKGASQNVLTSHLEGLFEEALRTNRRFSGSRFLKNLNGLHIDVSRLINVNETKSRIKNIKDKFTELYRHSLKSWNFIDRIYNTATLSKDKALDIGITGPSLRATGVDEDLRKYERLYKDFTPRTEKNGDALSRMQVRAAEIIDSCEIIEEQIDKIKQEKQQDNKIDLFSVSGDGIGACESPSGLVVYFIELSEGIIENVYISTPSLFGFKAFCDSLEGHIFTDFSFALDSFGVNFADCSR